MHIYYVKVFLSYVQLQPAGTPDFLTCYLEVEDVFHLSEMVIE
jgi:hypothetical protein